jgi:hypothetical protein
MKLERTEFKGKKYFEKFLKNGIWNNSIIKMKFARTNIDFRNNFRYLEDLKMKF